MTSQTFTSSLVGEFDRRIYEESIPRIENCLNRLSLEEIWSAPNKNVNSIGNLILHLVGNVRQWIGSGIGYLPDERQRDLEFARGLHLSSQQLMAKLKSLRPITDAALSGLNDGSLHSLKSVQGFDETPMSIIIHVIEHFSYHTGQIAQMTKLLTNEDLGFYAGIDLSAH